jgi:hypothetical protein
VLDGRGAGIPPNEFLKKMAEFEDGPMEAAVRWAVALDYSAKLMVQLQGLPTRPEHSSNSQRETISKEVLFCSYYLV